MWGQQLGPVHPLDDGPVPPFLVDPGLGRLSRLLDSVLRWDRVDQIILDYSHTAARLLLLRQQFLL